MALIPCKEKKDSSFFLLSEWMQYMYTHAKWGNSRGSGAWWNSVPHALMHRCVTFGVEVFMRCFYQWVEKPLMPLVVIIGRYRYHQKKLLAMGGLMATTASREFCSEIDMTRMKLGHQIGCRTQPKSNFNFSLALIPCKERKRIPAFSYWMNECNTYTI